MTDPIADERRRLIRQARQRLETLALAGLEHLALPLPSAPAARAAVEESREPATAERLAALMQAAKLKERPAPRPATSVAPASLFGEEVIDEPALEVAQRPGALESLGTRVAGCVKCVNLADCRTQTVFGEGRPDARLMFIGEAPGAHEDASGRPFVGPAGQLLTDMITKGMGLDRGDVYIANILKCRPPGNRDPAPEEALNCLPYLERQIAIVRPEFLCLLGRVAASILLQTALPAGKLRGRWQRYKGIPTIVTWHPAYLLRNPAAKKEAWADLLMLMQAMGLKPPERRRG